MQVPILEDKLKNIEATHKDAIDKLKGELKERNEEVKKLKADPKSIADDENLDGKGADEEIEITVDENESANSGWDTVTKGLRKKLGIK